MRVVFNIVYFRGPFSRIWLGLRPAALAASDHVMLLVRAYVCMCCGAGQAGGVPLERCLLSY